MRIALPLWPAVALLFSLGPAAAQVVPDPCSAAKATARIDQRAVEKSGVVKTQGTWEVSGGAAGVLLEIRIQSDRWDSQGFRGTKGVWSFAQALRSQKCGHLSFRVHVYPGVDVGDHLLYCLENGSSTLWQMDVSCAAVAEILHCDWECAEDTGQCAGVCSAAASAGTPAYRPFWGVNGQNYQAGTEVSAGPWTGAVHCSRGDRVSFLVKDHDGNGKASPVVSVDCGDQPGKP